MAKQKMKTNQTSGSAQAKEAQAKREKAEIQVRRKAEGSVEAFAALAQRLANGEAIVPPAMLSGLARRKHVRATLREDHKSRIEQRAHGAEVKFDKLCENRFDFFRGTALLFYRDMLGIKPRKRTAS